MKNWLVVANASKARVLEAMESSNAYVHIADLVHPESRLKGEDLARDRPGHIEGGAHGVGSSEYQPKTNARDREHDRFARELADTLNAGISSGRCAGLILVASNPFMGRLTGHLSERAHAAVIRTVASDFTAVPESELAVRLSAAAARTLAGK